MPKKIRVLADKILNKPENINLAISTPAEGILQQAFIVEDEQKVKLLKQLLKQKEFPSVVVFASTKEKVKRLYSELKNMDFLVKAFHSDLEQPERESILREFKHRQIQVLIGTDIISRGIDVEGINLVVNFDVPPEAEDYIHRIGRTARASTTGTAYTFINNKDQRKFLKIEKLIGKSIVKYRVSSNKEESKVGSKK